MEEQTEHHEQQQQQQSTIIDTTTTFVNQSSAAATAAAATTQQSPPQDDDAWWWEVENGDLILDLVPNIDAVQQQSESENINNNDAISAEFTIVLKHGRNTINTTTNTNNCIADNANNQDIDIGQATNSTKELYAKHSTTSEELVEKLHANYKLSLASDSHDSPAPSTTAIAAIAREQTLEEFKEELRIKRLSRQTAVQDLRDEIATLRRQLADEQELTHRLRRNNAIELSSIETTTATETETETATATTKALHEDGAIGGVLNTEPDSDDEDPQSRGRHANIELANAQLALQMANAENLSLRTELGVVQKQVSTLKEVIACCKQMLNVKEEQCSQLKTKLEEIELAFSEREMKIMSSNLRQEYERQLGNIRQLRQLYEERQRIALAEQENLQRLISIKRDELVAEQQKTKNIEEHNQTLMKEIESANNELATLREECNEHKFEKKTLKEEMGAVNTLFSQMVMGFNGENNLDIDRLTMMLEENRGLLNDMATKEANCSDGATLPKLLFELVEQAAISSKAIEGNNRSPTPTTIIVDSADEEEYATHQSAPDRGDNGNDEEVENGKAETATDSHAEMDDVLAVTDHNNTNSKSIKVGATSIPGGIGGVGRKHNRKSAGNRMKLATTTAAADASENDNDNANAVTTPSTTLKIHEPEVMSKVATTQEIIGNLPKVWKVLMELLSHHKIERVQFEEHGASEECYKSIETANGPKSELSVSKTYIKLKDLILEKKSLVKETNRLKTLNCHLEYRLNEQEKRLSAVSLELTKTWHLVGKMQRQHRQLHTQEQILRYQLQQKRRLLTELKDELEYCRRKWAAARAKNDESQEQCNDLRREFALRKMENANNSAESGYSDSGQVSDEELGMTTTKTVASGGLVTNVEDGGPSGGISGRVSGAGGAGAGAVCRRKRLKEMFEHKRKIKRMQSTSPGRAGDDTAEIVLRWNSAPPTCGWRRHSSDGGAGVDMYDDDDVEDDIATASGFDANAIDLTGAITNGRGAIPKSVGGSGARSRHRSRKVETIGEQQLVQANILDVDGVRGERAERIQRLEDQCKSLIQQVLETSDNREKLEVQLRSFQDEIAPVQHAVPLNDVIKKKRNERMTRASSVPVTGTLTPREEEYTRKRSERLGRLEEESRQLMSRIKRTSDRGHYLRCSLDRLRRAPSREGSFESNTEDESSKTEEKPTKFAPKMAVEECEQVVETKELEPNSNDNDKEIEEASAVTVHTSPLTSNEEAYTARRSARLQRLESESRALLNTLSRNNERGQQLGMKLDALHEQHCDVQSSEEMASAPIITLPQNTTTEPSASFSSSSAPLVSIEQRLENIEQISSNRMERLRILEEEGNELLNRLAGTSARGSQMIQRIAAREQTRQTSALKTTTDATDDETSECKNTTTARNVDDDANVDVEDECCASGMEATTVSSLMPTLNNVACSSIVSEELTDRVTVTTIPSQIAAQQQGAIPKQCQTKPVGLVLNAAIRAEAAHHKELKQNSDANGESLEDMVRRLRETPFPEEQNVVDGEALGGENIKEEEEKEERKETIELAEDKQGKGESSN